jgi:hypothetical protein
MKAKISLVYLSRFKGGNKKEGMGRLKVTARFKIAFEYHCV